VADVILELLQLAGKNPRVHGGHAAPGKVAGHGVVVVVAGAVAGGVGDGGADHGRLHLGAAGLDRVRRRGEQLGDVDAQGAGRSGEFFVADRDLGQLHFRQGRQCDAGALRELFEGQFVLWTTNRALESV